MPATSPDIRVQERTVMTAAESRPRALDAETVSRCVSPQSGDVVVMRERSSPVRYSIRQLPADARIRTSSQDQAVSLARMFAELHGVDVWGGEDHTFRLLEVYRPRPGTQADQNWSDGIG